MRSSARATEHLRRAGNDLVTHFSEDIQASNNRNLAVELYFTISVNLIGAFAFFGVEDLFSSKPPAALIDTALKYVRPKLKLFPPILSVVVNICDWMIDEDPMGKAHRAKEIIAECDRLLRNQNNSLTHLDWVTLQRYRAHLLTRS